MARSSIQGTEPAPEQPAGRDNASLGPGDSSDSGSDMMGVASTEGDDPHLSTDLAMSDDQRPLPLSRDTLTTAGHAAAGTGERRSAGADVGKPDGWDIGVDRILTPGGGEAAAEEEDPELAFTPAAQTSDPLAGDEMDDEDDVTSRKVP